MMIPLCGRRREVSEDVGGTVEDQETPVTNLESQRHALDTQTARTLADAVAATPQIRAAFHSSCRG